MLALLVVAAALAGEPAHGSLTLRITAAGEAVPARVELIDEEGGPLVAPTGLAVTGDCGRTPWHNLAGRGGRAKRRASSPEVLDVMRGTRQFYADGEITLDLPPGRYQLRVERGPEYGLGLAEVHVEAGGAALVEVSLERRADLPSQGWYSADAHLHIARPGPRLDDDLLTWMEAEDLHVANTLQMGFASPLFITPQRRFGARSVVQRGEHILVSGQEEPRTHLLGHVIVLGADDWLHQRGPDYLRYDQVLGEEGALAGMAHWGLGGADLSVALWAEELDLLEVLGFGLPHYSVWYESLDLGMRPTPVAGTDFPCGPALPGRDRFYTHVPGELTWSAWLEGVEAGRTFVTNGPFLELSVGGEGIGGEVHLAEASAVPVVGRVRFDPAREHIDALELVAGGEVVHQITETAGPGELRLEAALDVRHTTWVALRARGTRVDETPLSGMGDLLSMLERLDRPADPEILAQLPRDGEPRPAAAHTAPVWIEVEGSSPLREQPPGHRAAARWSARLDALEALLADPGAMPGFPAEPDGIAPRKVEAARPALVEAIARARQLLDLE